MKKMTLSLLFSIMSIAVLAQNDKNKDIDAIKSMCGCYEVGFNFAETFNYSTDSTYQASKVKHDAGLEWVELVTDEEDKLVLQHLLIVGPPQEQMIVKHWRQDWLYEKTEFFMYNQDNQWSFEEKPKSEVNNQWTQKVYQVDDSPRYEGSASWVHVDGRSFWENTTDAPLPRREITKRRDYNVMVRTNHHEITENGWIHDQDNKKVIRKEGEEDFVLAEEKGLNTYKKVDDSRCKLAQDYWKENKELWAEVRASFDEIFDRKEDLALHHKVDDQRLFQFLFNLKPEDKDKADDIVKSFVK